MLLKQDKLSLLEEKLEKIDEEEASPLSLGASRRDRNADRQATLLELDECLADYDAFAERTYRILGLPAAHKRDITSIRNWVEGTASVSKVETNYLSHQDELACLAPSGDSALHQLECWIEDKFRSYFRKSPYHNVSTDPNVFIYNGSWIRRITKGILLILITILLILPVVVCNLVSTLSLRILIVMACTISYLVILLALTKSKTMELVVAGATYATVLIVFVSGTASELTTGVPAAVAVTQ
ncbi:hypothetical protein QBC38DRAFT_489203 [Podospora fimiseda]|uniref:DUF6594 domain-containing protein n=1 Tax=Podospora fimiseda TaxID=252190 RepID=A0AAN6YNW9_9PEZI|nr:hypothetical protein QBC38DRAFT_489203 [Podospora fimiseda]